LADVAEFDRITIKINGALNAQPVRVALRDSACDVVGVA